MTTRAMFLALAGCLAVSACGGGGGDDDTLSSGTQDAFDLLVEDFDALDRTYGTASLTPTADMPIGGSATYNGSAVYSDVDTDPNLIIANPTSASQVEITANFTTGDIGGRLHDFRSAESSVTIDGDLALVNGFIQNNTMAADIIGSLEIDGVEADHTGGRILGSFIGPNAEAVGGPILRGGSPTLYNGAFIAER